MFENTKAFSGFSVDDLAAARKFYGETLGIEVVDNGPRLMLKVAGGNGILVYPKEDHVPATYTILNFPVLDIEKAIEELTGKGVTFDHHEKDQEIAWFKDPAGNILSVVQED
jgi:catechol 2,3-dioxygenase-like lactoylglutathione lyase family enzyme